MKVHCFNENQVYLNEYDEQEYKFMCDYLDHQADPATRDLSLEFVVPDEDL